MAYSLNRQLFVEHGPAVRAAEAAAIRSKARFLGWRKLTPDSRLAAVERALVSPANDVVDGYPLAL